MQHKTFETTTKQQNGQTYWVASTNHVDRDGDVMNPMKFDLSGWQRNGSLLLWGHDYHTPDSIIGRARDIQIDAGGFRVLPEWREPASPSDKMHVVRSLIGQGFAKAMSIGFRPLEPGKQNEHGGTSFGAVEILEISVIPVPANSFASLSYGGRRQRSTQVGRRELAIDGMQSIVGVMHTPEFRYAPEQQQAHLLGEWVKLATVALA